MDVAIEVRDLVVVRGHKEVLHGIGTSVATGGVTGLLAGRQAGRAGPRRADGRAGPGAARGVVAQVPRAGRLRCHPAGLQPRDGRGGAVRPADPHPRGPDHRRRHRRRGTPRRRHARSGRGVPAADPGTGAGGGGLMSPRILFSTTRRVLTQLRHDKRTLALVVLVPAVLLTLVYYLFDAQPA